jgi:hypothetical protein
MPSGLLRHLSLAHGIHNNSDSSSFVNLEHPLNLNSEKQQNDQIEVDMGGDSGTLLDYDSGSCLLGQQPFSDVFTITRNFQRKLHSK